MIDDAFINLRVKEYVHQLGLARERREEAEADIKMYERLIADWKTAPTKK